MNTGNYRGMGLTAVLISALFLFHPIVAGIDLLPDVIGYCLLYVGLSKLSDLNGHIQEAKRRFGMLLFVGAGQLFATYFVYGVIGDMMRERPSEMSTYEAPMLTLLFAFLLLVAEWCILIPAWKELFCGLGQMAERFDAPHLLYKSEGASNSRTVCEALTRNTTVFVIASSLLSVLPEASVLTSYEAYKGNPLFPFDWFVYIDLFRLVAGAISIVWGIVWLVSYLRCIGAFRRDLQFVGAVGQAYADTVVPQIGMLTVRRFKRSFLLFALGAIFAASFRISDKALLPGIVFAGFVIVGLALLGELVPKKKGCMAAAVLLAIVSALELAVNHWFLSQHLPEASLYEEDAYWRFVTVRSLDAAEAIATLVLVAALLAVLYDLVLFYVKVDYGTKESEIRSCYATERQQKTYKTRMTVLFSIFFLSAAASVADAVYRMEFGWIWIPALIASIIGIWNLSSLMQDLYEQIGFYYHSDGVNKNI